MLLTSNGVFPTFVSQLSYKRSTGAICLLRHINFVRVELLLSLFLAYLWYIIVLTHYPCPAFERILAPDLWRTLWSLLKMDNHLSSSLMWHICVTVGRNKVV